MSFSFFFYLKNNNFILDLFSLWELQTYSAFSSCHKMFWMGPQVLPNHHWEQSNLEVKICNLHIHCLLIGAFTNCKNSTLQVHLMGSFAVFKHYKPLFYFFCYNYANYKPAFSLWVHPHKCWLSCLSFPKRRRYYDVNRKYGHLLTNSVKRGSLFERHLYSLLLSNFFFCLFDAINMFRFSPSIRERWHLNWEILKKLFSVLKNHTCHILHFQVF